MSGKPKIIKVTETPLEEKAPPSEDEYEFVETFPPAQSQDK